MDKRWKRNVVSLVSSVMAVMRLPISCQLNGHVVPCASCLHRKWIENVGAGQFGILVNLLLCCLIGCSTWLSSCAANVGLRMCTRNCHIPRHGFSSGPRQESGRIRLTGSLTAGMGSLDRSPYDVVQMTVTLLSGSASTAG